MLSAPRPPIAIDKVFDDPGLIRRLVEQHAPYFPVQRYFASDAEYRATSGTGAQIIAPNFRGDWAYDEPLVAGVEPILYHAGFRAAIVCPQIVYCNLTWQLPFHQGAGHTDVPAFRGIDRTRCPIWFLGVMGHSGLFEAERIRIATAVAWLYAGTDGGFEYWPEGPARRARIHEGAIFNTALVGDNDRMFHRVRPVGRREDGLLQGMTLATSLAHTGGDRWEIREGNETRVELVWEALRISISWKARVFRDERERRRVDAHSDDLQLPEALERIYADLEARRIAFDQPREPLRDPAFIELLSDTYVPRPGA